MRLGNLSGRLTLFTDKGAIDVEQASDGRFASDPQAIYDRWGEFVGWHAQTSLDSQVTPFSNDDLGPPAPRPRQVFAIGANYRAHAAEGNFPVPEFPMVFTKWVSSFIGPVAKIVVPGDTVDWETELVVVVGKQAHNVADGQGWQYVAGLTAGQDVTERTVQLRGNAPQFAPSKSFPGFSPSGPWLVTPDEFADPGNLAIGCTLNGEQMQNARTSDMVFPVPRIIEELSRIVTLEPGDVIFTGTPAGVGLHCNPPRFLRPGDELVTTIEGIGQMHHRFVAN
ncbi:fumarylacetoacetate hydrolase family protein [Paraburkholderia sp. GAS32]|uniref:fumarylacetoacetate hydrolase family protein n=1 Tax=Paraburkholderia sp. GAS32 TaxID=3035129 RepID=UPI003D24EA87